MQIHRDFSSISSLLNGHSGVFVQGGAATPVALLQEISNQADKINPLEFFHIHIEGEAPHQHIPHFKLTNLFVGANIRKSLDYERVDYLPCFLSEIPSLLESGARNFDVALIHISPPDAHGYCSLGVSVDIVLSAIKHAKVVIAQVNSQMPKTHGDGIIHISRIHHAFEVNEKICEKQPQPLSKEEKAIGENIASLIEDGSTLQMGIGAIPDAVLASLTNHKNLGIHTEMFSNSLIPLLKSGVVNNSQKKIHPHKTVTGFAIGDQNFYDYLNDNPSIVFLNISYVNHPNVIKRNPRVVAINSAVEIDLSGQVCADSIGPRIISGVGGQMDFMRGAALSTGGKPIIALPSRTRKGIGRIVPTLNPGAGVVTTRQHVHYIVTEFGIAYLYGKTIGERAKALIEIAHPDEREGLERSWSELFKR